jgi:hypothetical protein
MLAICGIGGAVFYRQILDANLWLGFQVSDFEFQVMKNLHVFMFPLSPLR